MIITIENKGNYFNPQIKLVSSDGYKKVYITFNNEHQLTGVLVLGRDSKILLEGSGDKLYEGLMYLCPD